MDENYIYNTFPFQSLLKTESRYDANFAPLAAPEVVIKTTSGATSEDKVGIMATLGFQCVYWNSLVISGLSAVYCSGASSSSLSWPSSAAGWYWRSSVNHTSRQPEDTYLRPWKGLFPGTLSTGPPLAASSFTQNIGPGPPLPAHSLVKIRSYIMHLSP